LTPIAPAVPGETLEPLAVAVASFMSNSASGLKGSFHDLEMEDIFVL